MDPLTGLLTSPFLGPIGVVTWLARQVAEAAAQDMLDPGRIEAALLALERRLDAGELDEAAFEAEEAQLLDALAEMRAAMAAEQTDARLAAEPDPAGTPGPAQGPEPAVIRSGAAA